jgi:hypothetical protein
MKRKKCKCGRLFERRLKENVCPECVELSNEDRILRHGFDLKKSFRKRSK